MKTFKQFISESIIPKKSLAGDEGEIIDHDGGYIDIRKKTDASPRSQSVIGFQVPEEKRGQGIGDALVKKAKEKYNDLGAQVSSLASLKVFHNNGFRHPNLPNGSFEDHKKEFEKNWGSLFLAHKDESGKPYVSKINESLDNIQGRVVDVDELSKHLNKSQMKNLIDHPWHKTYAAYPGKPTAYRVSMTKDALGGGKMFNIEAGNGVPRNKETFGDKQDVRHMVSFEFYKNKIGNAHLFRNHGDQRHPETGQKVWVYHKSHKED